MLRMPRGKSDDPHDELLSHGLIVYLRIRRDIQMYRDLVVYSFATACEDSFKYCTPPSPRGDKLCIASFL